MRESVFARAKIHELLFRSDWLGIQGLPYLRWIISWQKSKSSIPKEFLFQPAVRPMYLSGKAQLDGLYPLFHKTMASHWFCHGLKGGVMPGPPLLLDCAHVRRLAFSEKLKERAASDVASLNSFFSCPFLHSSSTYPGILSIPHVRDSIDAPNNEVAEVKLLLCTFSPFPSDLSRCLQCPPPPA